MFDIQAIIDANYGHQLELAEKYINPDFAHVLKTIGFDVLYKRGQGAYLWDGQGQRYIDCLGGFGVFACGRNHPVIRQALQQAMDMDLPNLVKMGTYRLSGLLAQELVKIAPEELDSVYFCNCGASAVETALKYARAATGRARIVHCRNSYHGLTLGALEVTASPEFRKGFHVPTADATAVPFSDAAALEKELSRKDVAGFIFEPIQGKGVYIPDDEYLAQARALCTKYGTVMIADEVQTGFGRTGKMFAVEHWNIKPDIMAVSKALSGGYVPVGAVLSKRWIHNKVFGSMDRCLAHSNTFGQNDLAMVAGLATLHVLREEKIVENSAAMGRLLREKLGAMVGKYELVKDVRGKGLMVAIEFGPPKSLGLKMGWSLLHALDASLFPQAVLLPLFKDHHILAQVAGHHVDIIKLIPPLVLNAQDVDDIAAGFDAVVAACHKFPGPAWEVGKKLAGQALTRQPSATLAPR